MELSRVHTRPGAGCQLYLTRCPPRRQLQNHVCFCGQVTSQVPYFENFIGPPHAYTVDYGDVNALSAVLDNITHTTVSTILFILLVVISVHQKNS